MKITIVWNNCCTFVIQLSQRIILKLSCWRSVLLRLIFVQFSSSQLISSTAVAVIDIFTIVAILQKQTRYILILSWQQLHLSGPPNISFFTVSLLFRFSYCLSVSIVVIASITFVLLLSSWYTIFSVQLFFFYILWLLTFL